MKWIHKIIRNRRSRRVVVGFTTTCAIGACHHYCCEFGSRSWRSVLKTTLCDNVCQSLVTGRWSFSVTLVCSTNKIDRHDITEILLKVALSTINLNHKIIRFKYIFDSPVSFRKISHTYLWNKKSTSLVQLQARNSVTHIEAWVMLITEYVTVTKNVNKNRLNTPKCN
jgi:hypothetical protein